VATVASDVLIAALGVGLVMLGGREQVEGVRKE
jgi:hypothetical protein